MSQPANGTESADAQNSKQYRVCPLLQVATANNCGSCMYNSLTHDLCLHGESDIEVFAAHRGITPAHIRREIEAATSDMTRLLLTRGYLEWVGQRGKVELSDKDKALLASGMVETGLLEMGVTPEQLAFAYSATLLNDYYEHSNPDEQWTLRELLPVSIVTGNYINRYRRGWLTSSK